MPNGKVTLRDILELSEKMDDKLDKIDTKHCEMVERLGTRVSTIEAWQNNLKGRIAVAVGIATLAINFSWDYLKNKFKN